MMNGISGGMGAGAWLIMTVVWVGLIVLIVWALANLLPRARGSAEVSHSSERPEEILDRRLASGEIDVATYDRLRAKLHGGAHAAGG